MKLKYYSILLCLLYLGGCTKMEIVTPDFDVIPNAYEVKAGEELVFNFEGDPDLISFYSGEVLSDYGFKEGRILESDGLFASFKSHVAYGSHPDLLSVWISSDFTGNYTIEDVEAATWENEVSKEFILAPHSLNSTSASSAVPSGEQDLTSHLVDGKPLYFAFRYKKTPNSEGGTQRNWFVRDLMIESTTILGKQEVATGAAFTLVYDHNFDANPADKNSSINAAGTMTIRVPSTLGEFNTEVWAISPAMFVGKVDMGPDKATPIKGFVDTRVSDYTYIYETPGTYTATFVAANSNIYGAAQAVKQIEIKVVE